MKKDDVILIAILAVIVALAVGWAAGHYAGYQAGIQYQISNPANNLPECGFSMVAKFQGMNHQGYYIDMGNGPCVIDLFTGWDNVR